MQSIRRNSGKVYGIFALEGSYETGSYSEELLKERLAYYGASGMDLEITRIQLLTDPRCQCILRAGDGIYGK